jgi:periplasmic protein TonB
MHTWQRFTAIATGVAALHGAALWAMHSYRAPTDIADKPAALVTRSVEVPAGAEPTATTIALPAAVPPVPPKPATLPVIKNKLTDNPALAAAPAPSARTELPSGTNNLKTEATAANPGRTAASNSTGVDLPMPQTTAAVAASPPAAAVANAPQKTTGVAAEELNLVRPAYTQLTQRLDQTGRVQIAFEVDIDGHTVNARVAQSSGFSTLDTAALDAARKTRYKPAMCGDKKVQSKYTRNYAFGVDPLPDPPQPLIDCAAH